MFYWYAGVGYVPFGVQLLPPSLGCSFFICFRVVILIFPPPTRIDEHGSEIPSTRTLESKDLFGQCTHYVRNFVVCNLKTRGFCLRMMCSVLIKASNDRNGEEMPLLKASLLKLST